MQYLLTEEEYKNLANTKEAEVTDYVKAIKEHYLERSEFIARLVFGSATAARYNSELRDVNHQLIDYDNAHPIPKSPYE